MVFYLKLVFNCTDNDSSARNPIAFTWNRLMHSDL